MNNSIKPRLFNIALLVFTLTSIVFFSAQIFELRPTPPLRKSLPFYDAVEEERKFEHLESYEYCFEKARSVKPPQEKWIIESDACPEDVNVVILVKSSTDRNENRRIIRQTWGRNVAMDAHGYRLSSKVIFVIGYSTVQSILPINPYLEAENRKYKDILQIDVADGYIVHHFLRKTLNGFQFVDKYCPNVKMILIADDDSIIAPWLLFGHIVPLEDIMKNPEPVFFGGVSFLMNLVPRQLTETSRIILPREKYPCYSTPLYLQAFAMVISRRTMKLFLEETENYYSSIFLDDIYLSWLGYRLNLTFFEFPKEFFDGWCMENIVLRNRTIYEMHAKNDRVEGIAIFHQCDSPEKQVHLWQKLCESFLFDEAMILGIHKQYCDLWIKRALI